MAYCLDGMLDRFLVFHGAKSIVVEAGGQAGSTKFKKQAPSPLSLDSDSEYRLKV